MKRKTSLYATDMRHDIDTFEGGAGGSSEYSTEPVKVGKWIDGKDIYRKVITKEGSLNSGYNLVGTIEDYDTITNLSLLMRSSSNNDYYKDFQTDSGNSCSVYIKEEDNGVYLRPTGPWPGPKVYVIVEYTI